MAEKFYCHFYTKYQLSDLKTARTVWKLLEDPLVAPRRFDTVEDARTPFASESFHDAANMYEEEGSVLVKGRRASFSGSFSRQTERLAIWNFFIDLKAVGGKNEQRWLQWFFALCGALPVLYGLGCST